MEFHLFSCDYVNIRLSINKVLNKQNIVGVLLQRLMDVIVFKFYRNCAKHLSRPGVYYVRDINTLSKQIVQSAAK